MEKKKLEQALLDYAINEIDSDTVASILNVDANDIQGTLADFSQEWDEADEPEDSDAVIDKYVDIFTFTGASSSPSTTAAATTSHGPTTARNIGARASSMSTATTTSTTHFTRLQARLSR